MQGGNHSAAASVPLRSAPALACLGLPQDGAGHGQALQLAAAELAAPVPQAGVEPLGQGLHKVQGLGGARRQHDILRRGAAAQRDVVQDGSAAGEESGSGADGRDCSVC